MVNVMMEAALKYAKANIPVMPLHWIREDGSCSCKKGQKCDSKGKHPLYSGWYENSTPGIEQIKKWWTKTSNANIGIPTGEKSGWLVLDVDDGGGATLAKLEATNGKLPDTVTAITGSGGKHYVFIHPQGRNIPNKVKFAPGLDTRSTGGLIVATPSIHTSGNRYQWLAEHSPFDIIPAEAPEWLLKLMEVEKSTLVPFGKPNKAVNSISVTIDEGSRNSTLTSLAGTMRARGMIEESIYVALLAENIARCNPPLDEAEVKVIAHNVSRYQPNPPQKKYYHRTDSGNAEKLRDRFGEIIRYCPAFKHWLVYDNYYWRKETGELMQFAIKTARDMLTEASRIEDEATRKELVRHAMLSENAGKLKAIVQLGGDCMIVICKSKDKICKEGYYNALTIKKEYVVLAIEFYDKSTSEFSKALGDYVIYRLKDNDGVVLPYPSKLFDIKSGRHSSCWISYNKDNESFTILPYSWARKNFWDDYYNDDFSAIEDFISAEELILSEEE
jgi:putative DNA primase/helicase